MHVLWLPKSRRTGEGDEEALCLYTIPAAAVSGGEAEEPTFGCPATLRRVRQQSKMSKAAGKKRLGASSDPEAAKKKIKSAEVR